MQRTTELAPISRDDCVGRPERDGPRVSCERRGGKARKPYATTALEESPLTAVTLGGDRPVHGARSFLACCHFVVEVDKIVVVEKSWKKLLPSRRLSLVVCPSIALWAGRIAGE